MSRPGSRLVEHEQLRIVGHGEREGHLRPHPFRQAFQLSPLGQLVLRGQLAIAGQEPLAIEARREPADLQHGHPFVKRRPLGYVADAAANLKPFAEAVAAEHGRFAGVGLEEAEHDADGGRFAGAVFAEQSEDDSRRYGERDAVEGRLRAKALGHLVEANDGVHGGGGVRGSGLGI